MKKKRSIAWIAISLSCVLILVPVLCAVIYFSNVVSSRLETTARENASFYINQFTDETNALLDTLRSSTYYLISDDRTQQIMQREEMPSQMDRLVVEEGLSRVFLLGNLPDSNVVTGIYLVKDGQQYLSVLRSGIFKGTSNRIRQISEECGDYNSARDLYTSPSSPDYCYLIVDYLSMDTMNPLGKIIIELNFGRFINTSNIENIYQDAVVSLRSSTSGEVLCRPTDTAFTQIPINTPTEYLEIDNQEYYHTTRQLSPSHVQIDLFIPKQEIFDTINSTVKVTVFFTIIILIIALLIAVILLYFVFKPFKQMTQKLDLLATGDMSVRMDPTPYKETNQVALAFNDMTDRLAELFDEVYTKGLLLREAEFNLLESQIRPHFIFNVLELINMRCLAAKQSDICHIVSNLAQLLRSNITHKYEQTITFEDELRYVRYYLELQKERFEDKLNYSIDLEDDSILKYYLPKLTIQPLVENSIMHGLENKREGGWVRISIWEETDAVCVRICDDGIGFDISAIDWDSAGKDDTDTAHNHIALPNINRRIQILYGKPYGMNITSQMGKGTEILLTLPVDLGITRKEGDAHAENNDC